MYLSERHEDVIKIYAGGSQYIICKYSKKITYLSQKKI